MRSVWASHHELPVLANLNMLLDILVLWHGKHTKFNLKELMSLDGCNKEKIHRDYCGYHEDKKRKYQLHSKLPFSAVVALEDNSNPTRIILENGRYIIIPQGCMLIWRGDYAHAGAYYKKSNRRLFCHVLFSESDDAIIDTVEYV